MKVSNIAMNLLLVVFISAAFFPEIEARNLRHVADDSTGSTTERELNEAYSALDAATVRTAYSKQCENCNNVFTQIDLVCPAGEVMVKFECDMTNDDNYNWSSYLIQKDGDNGRAYPYGANCRFYNKKEPYMGTITNRIWCIPKADCNANNGLIELTSDGTEGSGGRFVKDVGHCPVGYSLIGSQCSSSNSEFPNTGILVDGGIKDGYPEGVYCKMKNTGSETLTIQSHVTCIPQ